MSTQTLEHVRASTRQPIQVPASEQALRVQRSSTFGIGGPVTAPQIRDAGRPLEVATRSGMEGAFGRDFGHIRVHADARAHDAARSLHAHAYTAGDHIVFARGAYAPGTPRGDALIAHELAHSVQQDGVQMKADGSVPVASEMELEYNADRAAQAAASGRAVGSLGRIGRPAVFRLPDDQAPGGSAATPAAGPAQKLPPGMTVISDEPPGIGTRELIVNVPSFALPVEKGLGPWVKSAYDEAGTGGRLVFSPLIEGGRVAAYKEGAEDYKSIWLGKYGFSSTSGLADAFTTSKDARVTTAMANKGVADLISGMSKSLKSSGCDIDHIVEKQMGGTSIPSNLQLLDSKKNQSSGRETYRELVKLVEAIRDPQMRGTGVRKLQLRLQAVTVAPATDDPSFVVEDLLRKGAVAGKEEIKAKVQGKPVHLAAGGVGEVVDVRDAGDTPIDLMAKRIVPGVRLVTYKRGPGGKKAKQDTVIAELDSRAISKTGEKADLKMTAEPSTEAPPAAGPSSPAPAGAAAAPATESTTATGESRVLKLSAADKKRKIAFYYPYLSPGQLDTVELDEQGRLIGTGIIKPSVPFFGNLLIRYGPEPDQLDLVAPIPAEKLKAPIPAFRFTGGELAMALSPTFVPKGKLNFEIGPKTKPIILGEINAKYEGGAFVAIGTLTPGTKLPGIESASGEVKYHSEEGWSGKLKATSTSIPNSTLAAELGFTSQKSGGFTPFATGGLTTKIRDTQLFLKIKWGGGPIMYYGGVTVMNPLPLVEKVALDGAYEDDLLYLKGDAAIKWKGLAATMHVAYKRKDGDPEGKFSGKADGQVKLDRATGLISLSFDEEGRYWGKGSISYQVTKDIRPTLGVELTKDRKVKIFGEVAVADIALTRMWPSPQGGQLVFIKGVGVKFSIPTPVPAVTAYGEIKVKAGLRYGVGPVMLRGLLFKGELYPLEDDPQVKASLKGKLAVPAYGEIWGTFGAYIGVEVALGAVGAKGGIEVTPALRIEGEGGIDFDAAYENAAFTFAAEAYAKGRMLAKLDVDLMAELYAAWGLFSHTWTYKVAKLEKQIGPELKLTIGRVVYGKNGEITWPNLSQISLEPKDLDPLDLVKDLMRSGKAKEN